MRDDNGFIAVVLPREGGDERFNRKEIVLE